MDTNVKIFLSVIGILILGLVATAVVQTKSANTPPAPSKYDGLAQCIKDSGASFYGAFWCPHCKAQKALFGAAAKLLPYIECSTADGNGQLQVCKDKGIASYPTWFLKDGTKLTNENSAGITLETLATKTGCVLPQ